MSREQMSLVHDEKHLDACHQRWIRRLNRNMDAPDYKDEWYREQCGNCRFWVPLTGKWGEDYGVCSNEQSAFDSQVRFEHDGCEEHVSADEWVVPEE